MCVITLLQFASSNIMINTYFYLQIKEFLQNYNKITDDCFSQCVYTLSQSRLTGEEVSIPIIDNCYYD